VYNVDRLKSDRLKNFSGRYYFAPENNDISLIVSNTASNNVILSARPELVHISPSERYVAQIVVQERVFSIRETGADVLVFGTVGRKRCSLVQNHGFHDQILVVSFFQFLALSCRKKPHKLYPTVLVRACWEHSAIPIVNNGASSLWFGRTCRKFLVEGFLHGLRTQRSLPK